MSTRSGRKGEQRVESWLSSMGWTCPEKNIRIPGGEIDRLFLRRFEDKFDRIDICIAEIKTKSLRSARQFCHLFDEAQLRTLIRPHQIRNLWRTAQFHEQRLRRQHGTAHVCTYVRYFLVVLASEGILSSVRRQLKAGRSSLPVRICHLDDDALILSWAPDVPSQNF
ncbi:MAG: YraN family protein [Silvanigrellaceae bacterium]